jgi:hypothetical protein
MVLTDTEGRLSDFMQELNRCIARCLILLYREQFPSRRLDAIWTSAESFVATILVTPEAVLDALVYTYTNPVKDGLVRDYRDWPGFNTRPSQWRPVSRSVRRPRFYFKNTPARLEYTLTAPTQLGPVEQAIATVELHIRQEQAQIATNLAAEGRGVLGAKAVCAVDPFDSPSTQRPVGKLKPQLAAGGDHAALSMAKQALKMFQLAYREAWKSFKAHASATFPGGTWLMRLRYGQRCTPLDACWCVLAT